jgi:hypothetical protein
MQVSSWLVGQLESLGILFEFPVHLKSTGNEVKECCNRNLPLFTTNNSQKK